MSPVSRSTRMVGGWTARVRSAVLHAVSLAHFAAMQARGRVDLSGSLLSRLRAEIDWLRQEIALAREEIRVKDARMARIPPARRPHYSPVERLAILELRAARGWSLAQTARAFQLSSLTVREWLRRLDEQGPDALVQLPTPVNKFPELVGYVARRLKTLCPALGRRKIAAMLARAGLHLGATIVGRMLAEPAPSRPDPTPTFKPAKPRVVTARRPNHVWHVDLTAVPIVSGFWCSWSPLALPQRWPFCWWVAVVVDHYSRRVMGTGSFVRQPTARGVQAVLDRAIRDAGGGPKYIVCDRGSQFWCAPFKAWCRRRGVRPRYGAIGRHGSIAVVERLIRTLKEGLRQLPLVPLRRAAFQEELCVLVEWYNAHRPHETLGGCTPEEVYRRRFPANRRPRYEPRERWPRGSPCAKPWALTRGRPGARLALEVELYQGRRHLPIVTLRRVA